MFDAIMCSRTLQRMRVREMGGGGGSCRMPVIRHLSYKPHYEKTVYLHMRKQRRRSAAQ